MRIKFIIIFTTTTFNGLYTKWDSFTPRKYKINLIRTLTYRCLRICSSSSLLQSTLFDLKNTLLQNGYPRGVLSYNINDVLNRQKNRSAEPAATVPKKDIILVLPFLGFQSEGLTRRVKSCISKFYGCVNLRVIFQNTCRVKSFFPYKDRFSRSQRSKIVSKPVVGTVIPSTSAKQKEDCMTGSPSISKLLHKSATPLQLQTIQFLPVITSNGTILKSSQLESPTCSVKLKKRY